MTTPIDRGNGGLLAPEQAAPQKSSSSSASETESALGRLLAELLGVDQVSVDHHFFDDLGADSLVMAHFCARVRKQPHLRAVSMKEIYRHPTIGSLAASVGDLHESGDVAAAPSQVETLAVETDPADAPRFAGSGSYLLCAVLQLGWMLGYAFVVALLIVPGLTWVAAGSGLVSVYLRAAAVGAAAFVGLCTAPIVLKWLLIGRWRPECIRIWSLGYLRFWVVSAMVRTNPLVLFVGSPVYVAYLRLLGARIGKGVVILSNHVPVCTDLLSVGDGVVIRKDAFFNGYRARAGVIETGPVMLGRAAYVGEATVLDIDTAVGDRAQLGHASSLPAGHAVPADEHWYGSPAQATTDVDFRGVAGLRCGRVRRTAYALLQLSSALGLLVPLALGGGVMLVTEASGLGTLPGEGPTAMSSWAFHGNVLAVSSLLFFGFALGGLVLVATVPRLLNLALREGREYPLYGLQYAAQRAIARLTNVKFYTYLFGDSAFIVHYLRWLGYDLSRVEQTGSNFGLEVKHDSPYLSSVGSGTMVADGLSIVNADFSSTSFRLSRARIGSESFVGNYIAYPAAAVTGDNCLLATKVMVPVEGGIRQDSGLLGSPSFDIPRSVQRDGRFDHLKAGPEFRGRLAAKTRHNLVTMALFLLVRWAYTVGLLLLAAAILATYPTYGAAAVAVAAVVAPLFTVGYFVLAERAAAGFRALRPRYCSIYEPHFWWHERYWKLSTQPRILDGTPFKSWAWRLLGVRIGRRVFDDGCVIMEKTLVALGDDCALNAGSIIQPHSQEDGTFKSDRITLGVRCTVGVGALVHYGVRMGDDVEVAPDAFVMKGAELPAQALWAANPAREARR